MFTGNLGDGKSSACNFFMQRPVFKATHSFERVTTEVASCVATIEGKHVQLVDTPGLLDPCSIEKEEECLEFARALISIQCGFHAVGVVLNLDTNIERSQGNLFRNLMSRYKDYLPYIFLMFTHGKCYGETDYQQNLALKEMINNITKHPNICQILKQINYRYLVIESIDDMEKDYHSCKSRELLKTIEAIFELNGKPATNEFALFIAQNFKMSKDKLETELTEGIKVATKKCKNHKKRKITAVCSSSSSEDSLEDNHDSSAEENDDFEMFFKTVEDFMHKAVHKDKKVTLVMTKDEKQTVTSLCVE